MSESATQWRSTADAAGLAAWLGKASRVVILTHTKPDGDAIGSTLGLARTLTAVGKDALVWYAGPTPVWLKPMARDTSFGRVQAGSEAPKADAYVVVDTGARRQLETAGAWLDGKADRAAIIDHHLHGDPDLADRRWLVTDAAAVCQPVARLCVELLGVDGLASLPEEIATPLYLGIATDTGWYRNSNVAPDVMRDAGDLLACGVDHAALYELTEQRDTAAHVRFMGHMLADMEIELDGQLAIMACDHAKMRECGVDGGETGGIVDKPLTIVGVRVSALLTAWEESPGQAQTKISMRSKSGPGAVDVNQIAQEFGGGGHARAAGAKTPMALHEVKRGLIAAVERALR